jgi:DNA-binding MarR family transcriptional regulator
MERLDNIALQNYLISEKTSHLSPAEKFVAVAIAKHRNVYSMKCCPGVKLLAKETGYSERTIIRAIDILERKGVVSKVPLKDNNRRSGMQYFFMHDLADARKLNDDMDYHNHFGDTGILFGIFENSPF